MELPRRIITGWSPRDVCGACGEGRRPVVEHGEWSREATRGMQGWTAAVARVSRAQRDTSGGMPTRDAAITGYACACTRYNAHTDTYDWHFTPPASMPGVVLDPFMGTGTTLLVASALGRTSHGVDLSADYCRLAQWRITDPGERARALEVDKPPVEIDGQDDLLDLLGAS